MLIVACMAHLQEPKLRTKGLFLSLEDRGRVLEKLKAWHKQTVSMRGLQVVLQVVTHK